MGLLAVAREHYRTRSRLVRGAEALAGRLWARVDRADIGGSWDVQLPALYAALVAAQQTAAGAADGYLDAALAAQDMDSAGVGRVNVSGLVGVASDGRQLDVLLRQPVITALTALGHGDPVGRALASGEATVRMIAATQVADAGRAADAVATTARRQVGGYVRMLSPPSCSRCVILAGRWYRYNAGFDRHPRCRPGDCIHIPASEAAGEDIRTRPSAYFESLSREEQDRVFTAAGAEAVRLGADIRQVVNARRGAAGLVPAGARVTGAEARELRGGRARGALEAVDVYGRRLYVTSEGITVRGVAGTRLGARAAGVRRPGDRYRSAAEPRLMPESILQIAGDREEAVQLLTRHGYIL